MNILGRVTVRPYLPERIRRLEELSQNLYWTWTPEARVLFRNLDRPLWEEVNHNPVILLREIRQDRLEERATDSDYLQLYDEVLSAFDAYMERPGWFGSQQGKGHTYAYFCAEYGWHEAVALYSGGLGVLAGDHTKAASDLGVPLVCIGLWYPEGYFHQRVAADGQQEAIYIRKSPYDLPLRPVLKDGDEVRISVTIQGREVQARAWQVQVGRVPVYLLDTDVPENNDEDRALLRRLYGGDQRTRIAQEIMLGIGGVRLLRALEISPTAWHMNEGHSAFMALERCREFVSQGMSFDQAKEVVSASTLFTVHTPVVAGNDAFSFDLVSQFFSGYWGSLGLNQWSFMELGRHDVGYGPIFSMPTLAIRFSSGRNGVAELHGATSRLIWRSLWPEVPTSEVPIGHVTNGVHAATWVSAEIDALVSTALPDDWQTRRDDASMWQAVKSLSNEVLWEVRQTLKAQSVRFLRRRLTRQLTRHGASPTALHDADELFDSQALTIGFARRFATYKRATLIFRDLDRLERILNQPGRPVQLVFAGKAHPADEPGQALINVIQNLSQDPRFAGKILFVEDYDMAVGRALTRGCDVWLNNPRRPLEASGTSGQKAAMNGILNLSILDGWWPEGYDGLNGWAIGSAKNHEFAEQADTADADALYDLLEREVVPLYYERDSRGIPQAWLDRVKDAIATISPIFNAARMVKDYVTSYYMPASERAIALSKDRYQQAAALASWRKHVTEHWSNLYFSAQAAPDGVQRVGDEVTLEAVVHPRELPIDDLQVEVVYSLEQDALEENLYCVPMQRAKDQPDGASLFRVTFKPEISGRLVYGVRVYPVHPQIVNPFDLGAIRWA